MIAPIRGIVAGVASRLAGARLALALVLLTLIVLPSRASASKYTPAAWKQLVTSHVDSVFFEQRKHVHWNRDQNQNFIDDLIDHHAWRPGDSVDVIVELNDCYPAWNVVARFSPFGTVTHVGQVVSCAYLRHVPIAKIDSLARRADVAMVELQTIFRPAMGVSVRAVQAAESATYGPGKSAHQWTGAGWTGWTGKGVNIAILDTGVLNGSKALPSRSDLSPTPYVAGFDATVTGDPGGPESDPNGVDPVTETHGTSVAAIALGRPQPGVDCGNDPSEPAKSDCAGVAPEAGLVDVKVWGQSSTHLSAFGLKSTGNKGTLMDGIEWVTKHKDDYSISVVNISLSDDEDCDGTCAICEAVDYLAAIGIVPVVGLGNASSTVAPGTRWVASPAAASDAITVAGTNDTNSAAEPVSTVTRSDDHLYSGYLIGPRSGEVAGPGEKPDIAAPAEPIETMQLSGTPQEGNGTSFAAPLVAGAAALVLEADKTKNPAAVKDLLLRTADQSGLGGAAWTDAFGSGFLDVYNALSEGAVTDVRFASCSGSAGSAGEPCPLVSSIPSWLNYLDLTTDPPAPPAGSTALITAMVTNDGPAEAKDVLVVFGYYDFGTGTRIYNEIGTVRASLAPGETKGVKQVWTLPASAGHYCLQTTLRYGFDTNFLNNTTQRNMEIAASQYDLRVENPFMVPARFQVVATPERPDWPCTVDSTDFVIGGAEDCPRNLRVSFRAPRNSLPGARANCNVAVYATPTNTMKRVLVGGVTVQTYVPRACRVIGQVVARDGTPLRRATVTFRRILPPGVLPAPWERTRTAVTDADGVFDLDVVPDAHQTLEVVQPQTGRGAIEIVPRCGVGTLRVELTKGGIRLLR